MFEALISIAQLTVDMFTPLAILAVGETVLQRTGRANLGLEGFLALGASVAVVATAYSDNQFIGLFSAALAGALFSALYTALTTYLKFNQFAIGLLIGFLGLGLADLIAIIPDKPIGRPIESGSLIHLSLQVLPLVVAVIAFLVLTKTWIGVEIRAIGANPAIARERGLRVNEVRAVAATIEGLLAGLAGAYISLALFGGKYWTGMTMGLGWVALGCVILGYWNPIGAVLASYLIGSLKASRPYLGALGVPGWVADVSPYLATIAVLCAVGLLLKKRPQLKPPYFET
ncbi:MAG: hypothetical protein QXE20_01545 [Acidilobaceae archaeon]